MTKQLQEIAPDEQGAISHFAAARLAEDLAPLIEAGIVTRMTPTSLELDPRISHEEYTAVGTLLTAQEIMYKAALSTLQWWRGDWLRHGEWAWGEKFAQAVEATGFAERTLQNCQWVAERFHPDRRRPNVSFGHHSAVASLPPADADRLLDQAEKKGMLREDLRAEKRRLQDRAMGRDPDVEEARRALERALKSLGGVAEACWGELIVNHLLNAIRVDYNSALPHVIRHVETWVHFSKAKEAS